MGFGWGDVLKAGAAWAINPLLAVPFEAKAAKAGVNKAGEISGLKSVPSDAEKGDLAQQRAFRDQMLAALQSRLATPMQAPQLGAPSWAGMTTPVARGTTLGTVAPPPNREPPPYTGPPGGRAPQVSGFGAVPGSPVPPPPAMAAEIERLKRKRILDAYGGALNLPGGFYGA